MKYKSPPVNLAVVKRGGNESDSKSVIAKVAVIAAASGCKEVAAIFVAKK
jgi:hypothetical protein